MILSQNSIYVSKLRELNRLHLLLQQFDVFNYVLLSTSRHKSLTWFFVTSIFCSNLFLMIFIVSIITTYFLSTSSKKTPVLCLYLWLYIKKISFRILLGGKNRFVIFNTTNNLYAYLFYKADGITHTHWHTLKLNLLIYLSLDCPFLIAPSVFSNLYLLSCPDFAKNQRIALKCLSNPL